MADDGAGKGLVGHGTAEDPWLLSTPPGTSEYTMHKDESADELKPAKEGTVEAWGRSEGNPVGGWYGLKKGLRGRFGMYVPPLMEALGLAELEHNPRNNRMRAI
jgi:hypothetical protein